MSETFKNGPMKSANYERPFFVRKVVIMLPVIVFLSHVKYKTQL